MNMIFHASAGEVRFPADIESASWWRSYIAMGSEGCVTPLNGTVFKNFTFDATLDGSPFPAEKIIVEFADHFATTTGSSAMPPDPVD